MNILKRHQFSSSPSAASSSIARTFAGFAGVSGFAQTPTTRSSAKQSGCRRQPACNRCRHAIPNGIRAWGWIALRPETRRSESPGACAGPMTHPPASSLFSMASDAISYTPGDAQAWRFPEKKLDDLRSPLRFLLGHTELAKELDGLSLTVVNGGYTLSGTPKGMCSKGSIPSGLRWIQPGRSGAGVSRGGRVNHDLQLHGYARDHSYPRRNDFDVHTAAKGALLESPADSGWLAQIV